LAQPSRNLFLDRPEESPFRLTTSLLWDLENARAGWILSAYVSSISHAG
jgi:hypothetical protein